MVREGAPTMSLVYQQKAWMPTFVGMMGRHNRRVELKRRLVLDPNYPGIGIFGKLCIPVIGAQDIALSQ